MRVKVDRAKVWCFEVWNKDKQKLVPKTNGVKPIPKPVMQEYERDNGKGVYYILNTILEFVPGLVDADGDDDYMELAKLRGDHNERWFILRQHLGKLS